MSESAPNPDEGLGGLLSEDEEPRPSREARRAKRRPMRKWLILLIGLITLLVVGVGFYVIQALLALTSIDRDETFMPTYENRPPEAPASAGMNFVLMGSDSRGADRGRSDTLIVAHLSGDRSKVYLISFPRDMYVSIPGHGKNKINAAYSFGGIPLAVQTLESLLTIRMNHVVVTDFVGFIGLTEQIGGVTVYNDTESTFHGYQWPRGEITIKGDEALTYVRQRYDLPEGDLSRAARQRTVVKAIAVKLMKPSVMANPVTFSEVAGQIGKFFAVDKDFTVPQMFSIASGMKLRGGDDIITLQAPISGFGTSPVGAAIDIVNEKQLAELADALKNDTMDLYWAKYKGQEFTPKK